MMDFMARQGETLSRSGAEKSTKRKARDPSSRPMPRAARIKLELKMEAAAEGPDSDEEMMALLGRGGQDGGGGGGAPALPGIGQSIKVRGGSFEWTCNAATKEYRYRNTREWLSGGTCCLGWQLAVWHE